MNIREGLKKVIENSDELIIAAENTLKAFEGVILDYEIESCSLVKVPEHRYVTMCHVKGPVRTGFIACDEIAFQIGNLRIVVRGSMDE